MRNTTNLKQNKKKQFQFTTNDDGFDPKNLRQVFSPKTFVWHNFKPLQH